ncbi:MAG TPA: Mur ligase family protein [Gemmatimonadaceae bacterium]|nr:Mur ligase family protein [Gemmatimonadaceae bacterium]
MSVESALTPSASGELLRVSRPRVLRGPNVFRLAPAIVAEVRVGELAAISPADVPGLLDLVGAAGVGTSPADAEGADPAARWPRLVAELALALQRRGGSRVDFATARPTGDDGTWWIAVDYEEEPPGIESIYEAEAIVRAAMRRETTDVAAVADRLRRLYERSRPGPTLSLLIDEARRRGIPVRRFRDEHVVQLGLGRNLRRLDSTRTDFTSVIAADIASDNDRAKRVLARIGLGVPRGDLARTVEDALEIVADIGFPVLLKPLDATDGRGISGRLDSEDAVRAAWPAARAEHPRLIVERYVEGRHHRVVVVDGRVVAVAERVPGGTTVDRTDEIHPENVALCELAAGAVGLDVAGLDVLTPDVAVPFRDNGAVFIGVTTSPGIRMHTHPDVGRSRDVPGAILDMLYPPGREATIPIVAVTGTNGKTTTTRLIAHILRQTGKRVGFTTTDGIYFQTRVLLEGDFTGPFAANVILSNPKVDVAVLETARGGILRAGLGFDACDVGVVLNVTPDHLGLGGVHTVEQLAEVKSIIPGVVRPGGHAVLNADDPLVYGMRARTRGDVVLYSAVGVRGNPRVAEHLADGGIAVVVDDEGGRASIVVRRERVQIAIASVAEVPLTVGGAAGFQVENVLAAVAATHALGVAHEDIRDGLLSFIPSTATTPGRLNVYRTTRGLVVVDYAHNPAAVRKLVEFARALPAERRIGVIAMPGDRRDDDLRELGRAVAGLDHVIVKEHEHYRRGRAAGEGARLIADGVADAGIPAERRELFLDEPEAVARALAMMRDGDVVLILADDAHAVLEQIRPLLVAG